MKILKLGIFSLLVIFAVSVFFTSCEQDIIEPSTSNISKEILDKLEEVYLNTNNVKKVKLDYPDGTSAELYQVEGDIMLSEEQIMNFNIGEGITSRQYRSNNLVKNGMKIKVLGFTGGQYALNSNSRTALKRAVNNFNNLGITFSLSFGASASDLNNADIVILDESSQRPNKSGGSAGLPKNGKPYKWVHIYNLGTNESVIEHTITHEIGHAIGLRHTDWIFPCSGVSTTRGGGFVHIPGTPKYSDPFSLMNSCIDDKSARRNFSSNDIKALEAMYPM